VGSIYQVIEILSKEKGIETQVVVDAVKDAMLVAARKQFKTTEDMVADFDPAGSIQIYSLRKVVEDVQDPSREIRLADARKINPEAELDSEIRIQKPTEALGRISAQTAKQVILQKVREAERETIHSEYSGRVGELVNCVVKRIEGQDMVVDLGKTEARVPKKEQSKLESFSVGDRVRCVIKSVEKAGKNAGVIVSRAAPELVMRLFEQEVPEIYDNTVVIKACAREAGERTKIAVSSRDRDVDSVGACVGMKGMRVQSIIRELRGEKIDIIEYSEDSIAFATHALSPAKISRVSIIDLPGKHMEVIVDDTQLSLAIGKKGQNVRLAAKLLGWKIDIKSEEEKRQEVEAHMATLVVPGAPVSVLLDHGLTESTLERLVESGVGTVEKLGSMTPEDLEAIQGIDLEMVEAIQSAVNNYYGQFETAAPDQEEVVLEEWNLEQPQQLEATEAAIEQEPPEAAELAEEVEEAIATAELLPPEQAEDAGISGLSEGSSTLGEVDEGESEHAEEPPAGAVVEDLENR
jgi:N utilization substance protein A